MALQDMHGIRFSDKEGDFRENYISFVHEILRTQEEKEFRVHHSHGKYYKIIFFNSGTRDIQIGSRVEKCGPGDIIMLAHNESYCGRSHDTFLDRYTLHIGENAFADFGSYGTDLMRLFTDRPMYTDNRFRLPAETAGQVNTLLAATDMLMHVQEKNQSTYMEAFANIIKILVLLKQSREEKNISACFPEMMLRILAYMESNYSRIGSEKEICREFSISLSGLWRMFRKYMDQTPGEYLRRIRLENARLGLEQGMSVTDACMECGFVDISHFIRLFRAAYGVTPYRYKKEHDLAGENGGQGTAPNYTDSTKSP